MMAPQLIVTADAAQLAERAADFIVEVGAAAVRDRGRFTIALAGGSTPAATYAALAGRTGIDWGATHVFLGDERMVPADDPASNFGLARRTLLDHGPVPPEQVHPVRTDLSPAAAAVDYAARMAVAFEVPSDGPPPRFDLVLLGLGVDGHTASLFPHAAATEESRAWVTWSPPGRLPPPVDRVTVTFPTLNAARQVVFLVSGSGKASALRQVLSAPPDPSARPASGVRPTDGAVAWLIDESAASLLAGDSAGN